MLWKPAPSPETVGANASPLMLAAAVTGTLVARPKPGSVSRKYSTLSMLAAVAALAGSKKKLRRLVRLQALPASLLRTPTL